MAVLTKNLPTGQRSLRTLTFTPGAGPNSLWSLTSAGLVSPCSDSPKAVWFQMNHAHAVYYLVFTATVTTASTYNQFVVVRCKTSPIDLTFGAKKANQPWQIDGPDGYAKAGGQAGSVRAMLHWVVGLNRNRRAMARIPRRLCPAVPVQSRRCFHFNVDTRSSWSSTPRSSTRERYRPQRAGRPLPTASRSAAKASSETSFRRPLVAAVPLLGPGHACETRNLRRYVPDEPHQAKVPVQPHQPVGRCRGSTRG